MNRIFAHQSGGELWQGGINDVKALFSHPNGKIRVIGLFAQEFQPNSPNPYFELIKAGYDDNPHSSSEELEKIKNIADHVSDLFSQRLREGKGCLSSCAMGLNRSGLVSALTLMKVAGFDPAKAIDTVRWARAPQEGMQSLCNKHFVGLIHSMAPKAGSKKTWTRWQR